MDVFQKLHKNLGKTYISGKIDSLDSTTEFVFKLSCDYWRISLRNYVFQSKSRNFLIKRRKKRKKSVKRKKEKEGRRMEKRKWKTEKIGEKRIEDRSEGERSGEKIIQAKQV